MQLFWQVCDCVTEHYDYLEIYDGPNDQSPQIAKLSGDLEIFSISSSGNSLFVKFKSNHYDDGSTGFLATIHYSNPYLNIKWYLKHCFLKVKIQL